MPGPTHIAIMGHVRRSIQRRAVAIAALECGEHPNAAAARAGVTRNMLNRWLRPEWRPGA